MPGFLLLHVVSADCVEQTVSVHRSVILREKQDIHKE
jgi:hypothetical protein